MHPVLPLRHILLALVVVFVWGSNFVIVRFALAEFPPFFLAALRFTLAFLPAALFVPPPKVPWRNLAAYGLLVGSGQFGFLYVAMNGLISPGLSSLVLQTQVFFTIALAMIFAGDRLRPYQGVALAMAVGGLLIILLHVDRETTATGLGLVLLAALCWAGGNFVGQRTPGANMLAYVVWASLFAVAPLLILSLYAEGVPRIAASLSGASPLAYAAALWQGFGNALFAYAIWAYLLARHKAATVTPMALLVPLVGMISSALVLGEELAAWKLIAGVLVIGGLGLNLLWPRLARRGADL